MVQIAAAWRVAGVAGRVSCRGLAPLKMAGEAAKEPRQKAKGKDDDDGPPLSEKDQKAVEKLQARMEADPTFDPMKGK